MFVFAKLQQAGDVRRHKNKTRKRTTKKATGLSPLGATESTPPLPKSAAREEKERKDRAERRRVIASEDASSPPHQSLALGLNQKLPPVTRLPFMRAVRSRRHLLLP